MASTVSFQQPEQTANRPDVPKLDLIPGLGLAGCCKTTINKGQQSYLWRVFKHTSIQDRSIGKMSIDRSSEPLSR